MYLLRAHADEILRYAKEAVPHEACGVTFGHSIRSITNRSTVEGYYEMDSGEQLEVWLEAAEKGEVIEYVWHSHPTRDAIPSPADIEMAIDGDVIYLICAPTREGSGQLRAWRILDGVSTEIPIELED